MLKNKRVWAGSAMVVAVVGGWLAFGFFGIHKAFVDDEVSEGVPLFDSGAQPNESIVDGAVLSFVEKEAESPPVEENVTVSADGEKESEEALEKTSSSSSASPAPVVTEPTVVSEKSGSFSGLKNYSVSGSVSILTDGQQRFLRFEDEFSSSNGPDLKVYLRSEDGDFINLGKLRGNKGAQNYEVDIAADLEKYNTVEIWCERFSVGFGSASLA